MYVRGDRVVVEGLNSRSAILRVWEVKERGLLLCTEEGYQIAEATGQEPVAVGFPMTDIRGKYPLSKADVIP